MAKTNSMLMPMPVYRLTAPILPGREVVLTVGRAPGMLGSGKPSRKGGECTTVGRGRKGEAGAGEAARIHVISGIDLV